MRFLVHDDVISAMIIIKDSQKIHISINQLITVTTTKNVFFKRYDVFFLLKFFLI